MAKALGAILQEDGWRLFPEYESIDLHPHWDVSPMCGSVPVLRDVWHVGLFEPDRPLEPGEQFWWWSAVVAVGAEFEMSDLYDPVRDGPECEAEVKEVDHIGDGALVLVGEPFLSSGYPMQMADMFIIDGPVLVRLHGNGPPDALDLPIPWPRTWRETLTLAAEGPLNNPLRSHNAGEWVVSLGSAFNPPSVPPQQVAGVGDHSFMLTTAGYPLVLNFEAPGTGEFEVSATRETFETVPLVAATGRYQGRRLLWHDPDRLTSIDVQTTGPWTITVYELFEEPTYEFPVSGMGDDAFSGSAKPTENAEPDWQLHVTHVGESSFQLIVHYSDSDGDHTEVLVDVTGDYSETIVLPSSWMIFEVITDGSWVLDDQPAD